MMNIDYADTDFGRDFRDKIPFKNPASNEYKLYEALIPVLRARKPSDTPRIVVVTDIEQDYDDLMAIIFLSEMHRLGAIELAGFVANHKPAIERAKFLRSIVHLLGLKHLEVAQGTEGLEKDSHLRKTFFYELKNTTFASPAWNSKPHSAKDKNKPIFRSGTELIETLARQVDQGKQPLTVLLISSLQDISEYFDTHRDDPNFLKRNFKKFVSQGGYKVVEASDGSCALEPTKGMANNDWHPTAARNYHRHLAELGLPSDAWSREAAKVARLDGSTVQTLAQYGPIGAHLSWLWLRQEFKFYWDPINAPYLPHLNQEWYLKTRLVLDPSSDRYAKLQAKEPPFEEILPLTKVIVYDGCAAMGAVGDDVMRALGIMGDTLPAYNMASHKHRVFGATPTDLGGVDGARLGTVIKTFLIGGLMATSEKAEKIIPSSTVMHKHDKYSVDLDTFRQQLPHLKEFKKLEMEGKQGNESSRRKAEQLKAATMNGQESPMLPTEIPYELLYQEAAAKYWDKSGKFFGEAEADVTPGRRRSVRAQ